MGILKIELEVPDFKEAIELSMILKKDGEVIASSTSLDKDSEKPIWKQDMPLGPGTLWHPNEEKPIWKQASTPEPSKFVVGDDPTQKGPCCNNTGGFVSTQSSGGNGNFMNINIDDL